eukprot:11591150-Alexandrium_andersonii.AAC.1
MSASLVGSEMCIRDSRPGGHRLANRPRQRPPCPRWRLRRRSQPHPWRPVSYTHLTLPTICSV